MNSFDQQNFRGFNVSCNSISHLSPSVTEAELSATEKRLMMRMDTLETKLDEIINMIRFSPGQVEFCRAQEHWDTVVCQNENHPSFQ